MVGNHQLGSEATHGMNTNTEIVFVLLLVIMLVGLLLSFFMYAGPNPRYDDTTYLNQAGLLMGLNPTFILNRFTYGYLSILPIAISFYLFGIGAGQAILPSIVEFEFIILIAFVVGKKVGGNDLAILSAFLVATFPFLVGYSTRVMIDITLGAAASLAVYLLTLAYYGKESKKFDFLVGAFATLPIYIKTEGILFLVITAAYLVFLMFASILNKPTANKKKKEGFTSIQTRYILLGMLLGFVIYLLPFYFVSHNLFFIFNFYSISPARAPHVDALATVILPFIYNSSNLDLFSLGIAPLLALFGTILAFRKKKGQLLYIASVNWFIILYFIFGSSSLSSYIPIPLVSRLFGIIALPLAIMAAYSILEIYQILSHKIKKNFRVLYFAIVIAVIMSGYLHTYGTIKIDNLIVSNFTEAYSNTFSYINSTKTQTNMSVYIQAQRGFRLSSIYFMDFLSAYRSGYHFRIVNYSYSEFGSKTCLINNKTQYYLLNIYDPQLNSSMLDAQNTTITKWIGNNCTVVPLTEFNPQDHAIIIYIYKLEKK